MKLFILFLFISLNSFSANSAWDSKKTNNFIKAIESGNAKEIASFLPEKLRVGPCESETEEYSRQKVAKAIVKSRSKIKLEKQKKDGLVFSGFPNGIFSENDPHVLLYYDFSRGWFVYCSESLAKSNVEFQ